MKVNKLIACLLLCFMANISLYAQTKSKAPHAREEYIEVEKNVRLHITDLGEGKPIVLIHGWPLSDAMYEYQYQYLVEKGFRVIGITLRGFGKSDGPYGQYDFDTFSDDIKIILDKLKIEDAVLGGFSLGGAVVIHYVDKYNAAHIGKLALFAAAAPSWIQRPEFPYGLTTVDAEAFITLTKTNRPQVMDNFDKSFAATEDGLSKGMKAWLRNINMEANPYAATQAITALSKIDLRPALPKIKIPVAIFHGVHDKLCSFMLAEELHKGIKNSTIIRFENSGHALFIEEMDKFNMELENFARK